MNQDGTEKYRRIINRIFKIMIANSKREVRREERKCKIKLSKMRRSSSPLNYRVLLVSLLQMEPMNFFAMSNVTKQELHRTYADSRPERDRQPLNLGDPPEI